MTTQNGFSLIELIIVLALLGAVSALAWPAFDAWQARWFRAQDIDRAGQWLRTVQTRAESGHNGVAHGLKFLSGAGKLAIYQGDSYEARDSFYDLEIELEAGSEFLVNSGGDDINFGFRPDSYEETKIEARRQDETLGRIFINQAGVISWP